MNKTFILSLLSVFALHTQAQELPTELQTPEIVSVNRLPMRAQAFAFENQELASERAKEKSQYFISLNGTWKFNWVKDPRKRPTDFFQTSFDDTKWDNFKVPANWETNGYGTPIYVNQPYEFAGRQLTGAKMNPPFDIPADNNPVGSYRKKITIPENWNGRQVFINLGAVKSAFYIWVNGKKVGYSEDSKLAAEFDITKYVKPGENLVALQVYRWSDGSYLECQDMWRISGIERDVYVYSTPKLNVRDFKTIATLDETYTNGLLNANITVDNYKIDRRTNHSKADSFYVSLNLVDAKGTSVWKDNSPLTTVLGNFNNKVSFKTKVDKVKTWSAETPYLYTLYITLKDSKQNVIEVIPQRIGFRSVEIKGSDFLVNGKRVFLKGVNRHEHNATQGHTLTHADMEKDMEMMKKLNVNAVRHSHYPPDPYWMQLCDEYGLYVIDEANIESHGRYYSLETTFANDKQWRNPHLERITRMYERDKNHASVVTWSLGNEAGNGVNFYEAYDWLKKNDIRPVQYERAEEDFNTDMIVPQYPSPNYLPRYAKQTKENRPFIMSEYAHIMGNSLGNFKEYWDAIENNPKLQGGFVWEWIDQAIDTVKNGKRIMAYGGDFPLSGPVDENFSDNDFCVKGVVTAYRGMTPMAVELKKVHQYIKTTYNGTNQINVNNSYFFKDISNIQLNWEVLENGKVVQKGTVANLNVGPRQTQSVTIPFKANYADGKEYFLNIHYVLKTAEPFLEKGYEIAYEQIALAGAPKANVYASTKKTLNVEQTAGKAIVKGSDFTATFDLTKGTLVSYLSKGQELLVAGPQPGFYRAPTDNDIGAGINKSLRMWRNVYQTNASNIKADVSNTENTVTVTINASLLNGDEKTTQTFTVLADGTIKVDNQFKAVAGNYKSLMRVGNDLQLNQNYSNIKWYGRGPGENYVDRKTASLIGTYQSTVADQYFTYARPQESGNKTDVRWVSFTNKAGKGLRFEFAEQLLSFNALPYAVEDLDPEAEKKQYHSGELVKRNQIYVHMDLQQLGVQGIDSWGSMPLIQYQVPFKDYSYSYYIKRIK
jgi:beta-galactosidase